MTSLDRLDYQVLQHLIKVVLTVRRLPRLDYHLLLVPTYMGPIPTALLLPLWVPWEYSHPHNHTLQSVLI